MARNDKNLKDILAANLVYYRKSAKLTQIEIAEKFNYSDKAISKWERGEAAPDIFVLKDLADFYGVPLTDFFKERHVAYIDNKERKHILLTAIAVGTVWLIVTLLFVIFTFILDALKQYESYYWLIWIYAIPLSALTGMILSAIWFKNKLGMVIFLSIMVWGLAISTFLTIEFATSSNVAWTIMLLPIPIQAIIILIWKLGNPVKKIISLFPRNKDKKPEEDNTDE